LNEPAVAPEKARAIIEAILLTAETPVTPGRLTELLDGLNGRDIRQAIDQLKEQYDQGGHGLTIVEVAGGYQLATRQEAGPWIRKFHKDRDQVRLSQAAMETLAIVAFRQPITRIDIDSIRGVNSVSVLQTLMEFDLVRIVGRSDGIGKPMLFGTTREFLIHFGLKTLADLPKPKELEELLAAGEQKARSRGSTVLDLRESPEAPGEGRERDAAAVRNEGEDAGVQGPGTETAPPTAGSGVLDLRESPEAPGEGRERDAAAVRNEGEDAGVQGPGTETAPPTADPGPGD
jgi:segregation and condensation protein B